VAHNAIDCQQFAGRAIHGRFPSTIKYNSRLNERQAQRFGLPQIMVVRIMRLAGSDSETCSDDAGCNDFDDQNGCADCDDCVSKIGTIRTILVTRTLDPSATVGLP
jgi:hypothetical protein